MRKLYALETKAVLDRRWSFDGAWTKLSEARDEAGYLQWCGWSTRITVYVPLKPKPKKRKGGGR